MKPEETTNFYKPTDSDTKAAAAPSTKTKAGFSWMAPEYLDHDHGTSWYGKLIVGTVVLAAVIFLVTRDYFATGTILLLGVIVGVAVGHKPEQIEVELSQSGVRVGQKTYNYNLFKSFSIIREGTVTSFSLTPIKRFMPPISAYFDPGNEQKVTTVLGEHLPYEPHTPGPVDKLTARLHM